MNDASIGIIANPDSGKDIRRLVGYASSFDNNEKINIVRRVLLAIDALGIGAVWFMPDRYGIVGRAAATVSLNCTIEQLPMELHGDADDSTLAARLMRERGIGCLVTLGGDGTNRAVAKESANVPIVPISSGTNNVFPVMTEGTLAGMAAAAMALGLAPQAVMQSPRLEVAINGVERDMALIDVVSSRQGVVGSRALWDVASLQEVVLSRIAASAVGFCGLGGLLFPGEVGANQGAHIVLLAAGERQILAPVVPGLLSPVGIEQARLIRAGETIRLHSARTIALDGEREIELVGDESIEVTLRSDGPMVVDIPKAITAGAAAGLFTI